MFVEDRPGALLFVTSELKKQNLDLMGLKGVSHTSRGDILLIPKDPDKFRSLWAGRVVEEGTLFFLSGVNTVGALEQSLESVTKADVNIVAIEAQSLGTRFAAFVWVSPQDVEKTARALAAK